MLSRLAFTRQTNVFQKSLNVHSPLIRTGRKAHVRFLNTPIKPLDYESKYADKLKAAAKNEGTTVEALKNKIKEEATQKLKAARPKPVEPKATTTKPKPSPETVAAKSKLPYDSSAPTLDKLVKLELFEKETPENIEKIWTAGHANKDCITATIPSAIYDTLYKRSQAYPMFIVPMPREEGVEFYFLQFSFNQCHFTSLLEYKAKGAEARPFLTLTHFTELQQSKGIVLMKGDITDEPRMLDASNAQFLAFALQQFYATGSEANMKLVEKFHKSPQTFDFQDLIKSVETLI
ncbi:ATP11 protein-domain-containing protein [Sporodiniella umbellata]|nr:ATP11 protein-domain-containing protein [Sporodiniella umbellata]